MPYDQTPRDEPERPERKGKGLHRFDVAFSDKCAKCGLLGRAHRAYPGTPCDTIEAARVNRQWKQLRASYRRGGF